MGRYDALLAPITLGAVTLPNRIVRTAHGTGLVGEDLIAYHEARAAAGVGLTVLQATSVHRRAPSSIPLYDDAVLPFFRELSGRLQRHGGKVFQQLQHAGAGYRHPGAACWSASAVPNPIVGLVPTPMTTAMIDEVVAAFAAGARRCRDGGLDGVEVHAGSGYLLEQFLSPATNHRDDDYGGPLENRARFLVEVLQAVRAEVGPDYPVGVRLSVEEHIPGGLDAAGTTEVARLVEPLVDFIDTHMGAYWRFHKMLGTMEEPLAYEVPASQVLTRAVSVPTIVTGRIMTLDDAAQLVETGVADMVSLVRALIADPELVTKSLAGRADSVRPCVGTNEGCVGRVFTTGRMGCIVNVAAGHEATVPFEPPGPAPAAKRVLVVGGGPAGLEAARTLALRGHSVELREARDHLGGQAAIAAAAPYRGDVGVIVHWLEQEVRRLGVRVRRGTPVDPDAVLEFGADEVVIATGAEPRRDGFQVSMPATPVPGHDLPHVHTSWEVFGFGGSARVGRRAMVFDDTGTWEAISVCEQLLAQGAEVHLVSRLDAPGARVLFPPATVAAARERLMSGAFTFTGASHLCAITADEVSFGTLFTSRQTTVPADKVVLVGFGQPARELAAALDELGVTHHLLGDASGGSDLHQAIHDAARVTRVL